MNAAEGYRRNASNLVFAPDLRLAGTWLVYASNDAERMRGGLPPRSQQALARPHRAASATPLGRTDLATTWGLRYLAPSLRSTAFWRAGLSVFSMIFTWVAPGALASASSCRILPCTSRDSVHALPSWPPRCVAVFSLSACASAAGRVRFHLRTGRSHSVAVACPELRRPGWWLCASR